MASLQQTLRDRSRSPMDDPAKKKPRLASPEQNESLVKPAPEDLVLDAPLEAMHMTSGSGFGLTTHKKQGNKKSKRKDKNKHKPPEPYSNEDIVHRDVVALLGQDVVDKITEEGNDWATPFSVRDEVELTVFAMSSSGECPVPPMCLFSS